MSTTLTKPLTWIAVSTLLAACSAAGSSLEQTGNSGSGAGLGQTSSTGFNNTGGNTGFNGEECGKSTFGNEVPGALLIVLDKSGSMSDPPDDGGVSKWSSTVQGINAMVGQASPSLEMGLLPYPAGQFDQFSLTNCLLNSTGPGCDAILADSGCSDVATSPAVGIAPLSVSGAQITSYLGGESPNGNTPTRYALKNGYDILKAHGTTGQRYALLMTDGQPTVYQPGMLGFPAMAQDCGTEADIEAEVLAASNGSPGVSTFVIGSPGSEGAASFLSQLAINGNTQKSSTCSAGAGDCHYQIGTANFQQELSDVLETIAGVISDCVFDMPEGEDIDPNLVNITIETDNGTVEVYKDTTKTDGWDYTDGSQTKVQLFGPACDEYKNQKGNTITIILGCETVLK